MRIVLSFRRVLRSQNTFLNVNMELKWSKGYHVQRSKQREGEYKKFTHLYNL